MAASFVIADPFLGNPVPVSATATVQKWPLGLVARAVDQQSGAYATASNASTASSANTTNNQSPGGMFMYCQGSDVASVGQAVHISNGSAVQLATANTGSFFPIGVAAGLLSASNVFGWVQVQGFCDYAKFTNSSVAAGARLYPAAGTAGVIGTVSNAGAWIVGMVAPNSYTSSQTSGTVWLNWPFQIGSVTAVF